MRISYILSSLSKLINTAAIALVCLAMFLGFSSAGKAQQESTWSDPVNLSRSGSSTNPTILSDGKGNIYSIWYDVFDGFQYVVGDGQTWTESSSLGLPENIRPNPESVIFIHDKIDKIHMFWMNENRILFYAYTKIQANGTLGGWNSSPILSVDVVDFSVTLDTDRMMHLIFQLGRDTRVRPAGIYYMKISPEGGVVYFTPLDLSPYYRSLTTAATTDEIIVLEPASVSISTIKRDQEQIILASWNNPQIKQLYFSQSNNSGTNWEPAEVIVSPQLAPSVMVPENPYLVGVGSQALLFWESNNKDVSCTLFYQVLDTENQSWGDPKSLFEERGSCPLKNQFMTGVDGKSFLFSDFVSDIAFTVWNGEDFQAPQFPEGAAKFSAPDSFDAIQTACHQIIWDDDQVYLIGCQSNEKKDIWVTARPVELIFASSDASQTWSQPELLTSRQTRIESLKLFSDSRVEFIYSVWSEPESDFPQDPGNSIYYADWETPQLIDPSRIFTSSTGKVNQPAVTVDTQNQKYIVWSGGESGELNFSWSSAARAKTHVDWFQPVTIPTSGLAVDQPLIQVGRDGSIFIAYLVPFNEGRGVYLVSSTDQGSDWTQPVRVFDAVAESCETVDQLSFAQSEKTSLHLSWVCSTIPSGTGARSFRYARSVDKGLSWTTSLENIESKVIWGRVVSTLQGELHLVWEEIEQGRLGFYERVSNDDGASWSITRPITFSNPSYSPVDLASDPAGRLYLCRFEQRGLKIGLDYWVWENGEWRNEKSEPFIVANLDDIEDIAATVVADGRLAVVYSLRNYDPLTSLDTRNLFYTALPIDLPAVVEPPVNETPLATADSVMTATPANPEAATPLPTPTENLNAIVNRGPIQSISRVTVIVIVTVITLALVGLALLYQLRRKKQSG